MSSNSSFILNRVFTRDSFRQVLEETPCESWESVIRNYAQTQGSKNNRQIVREVYRFLGKQYRNEYYYKNTILNELLFKTHRARGTTALTEVNIGRSKVDFILINGAATAYEIKTELDNLDRLESQIADYSRAFSIVSILSSEGHLATLEKRLATSPVGIYVLGKKGAIEEVRPPQEWSQKLDPATMFSVLRKREYEEIVLRHTGGLPIVSQYEHYKTCKRIFCSLGVEEAYGEFVSVLRNRGRTNISLCRKVPHELRFLAYFSDFDSEDYQKLRGFLSKEEV